MKVGHMIANRRLRVWIGLFALAALFVLVVLVSARTMRTARVDLTADHLYTLTPGTLSIIDSVEQPIQLTMYFSDHATRSLPQIRSYEQRVREMLREVTARSHGRIRLRVIDPVPYSDDEDTAEGAGLNAMGGGSNGERVFFGLVGRRVADTAVNDTLSLPYFDPTRESFLEYDVAKLIYELSGRTRPMIGVVSSLPVNGNPLISEEPWTVVRQMRQLFDVRMIDGTGLKAVDPAIRVMILVHPKHLGDDALYALDQYVLHGGRLLVFVDPLAEMDNAPFVDASGVADDHQSSLPKLFAAWGIDYNANQVVLDRSQSLPIELGGLSVNHPAMVGLGAQNLSHDDVVTASLQRLTVSTAGHFELARDSDSSLVPLIQSSTEAMLAPVARVRDASGDPSMLLSNYVPGDEHYVLAARVRGTFRTAFPERHEPGHLDHAAGPNEVLVVADTDLLSDRLWLETKNVLGSQVVQAFANNGDFLSNLVDNLSGSSALLSIRGRAGSQRPFTRVEGLQAEANQKYLTKKRELERELFETQRRVAELQPSKGGTVSIEQKHELEKFVQRKLAINKELRDVQHQLNAEIDALGLRVKFVNIVLVPALVALAGLLYGWRRGRRTRRRA
jgi:gliding motility-associatede transport system auxiliary component